jgi:hypothetical protein
MRGVPSPIENGDTTQPINLGYLTSGELTGLTVNGTINARFAEVKAGSFVSGIGVNSTNDNNFEKDANGHITKNGAPIYAGIRGETGKNGDSYLPYSGATGTFYGGIELYNGLSMNDQPLGGYHISRRNGVTGSSAWNQLYSKNLNEVSQYHFHPNQQNTLQVLSMKVDYLLCHLFGSNDLSYLLSHNECVNVPPGGYTGNTVGIDSF